MARAAGRVTRALGQEGFDDAVFQRMEGDDDQTAAGRQRGLGGFQTALQLTQFVVDGDTQGLEHAGRGVDRRAATTAQGLFDHLGQIQGAAERLLDAAAQDGGGHPTRLTLVAVLLEDMGQRPVIPSVDEIGGGRPRVAHPHIQRPVAHEGEAALGLIQLHGRDANIEDSAVQLSLAALGEGLGQAREGGADQLELARIGGGDGVGVRLNRRVAVQTDDLGPAIQNSASVAASAEGGVDDDIA
ncbi:hypothetical protein D3C81_1380300 [compost metagenome]